MARSMDEDNVFYHVAGDGTMAYESQDNDYQTAEGYDHLGYEGSQYSAPASPLHPTDAGNFSQHGDIFRSAVQDDDFRHQCMGMGYALPSSRPRALSSQLSSDYQVILYPSSDMPDTVDEFSASLSNHFPSTPGWSSNAGDGHHDGGWIQSHGDQIETAEFFQGMNDGEADYALEGYDQSSTVNLGSGFPQHTGAIYQDVRQDTKLGQINAFPNYVPSDRLTSNQPWTHLDMLAQHPTTNHHQGYGFGAYDPSANVLPSGNMFQYGQASLPERMKAKGSSSSVVPATFDLTESTRTLRPLTSNNLTKMVESMPGSSEHERNGIPTVVTEPCDPRNSRKRRTGRRQATKPPRSPGPFLSSSNHDGSDVGTHSPASITPSYEPDVLLCFVDGCRSTFKGKYRRGTRQRHMRHKHGLEERKYPCEGCGEIYLRSDALLKHQRKAHPEMGRPAPERRNRNLLLVVAAADESTDF